MGNLQGGELLLLIVLALIILGPERLPDYAAKLAHGIRTLRDMAEGARSQLRDEMGPAFEEIDWQQLDPRRYDPRRIVREALSPPEEPAEPEPEVAASGTGTGVAASGRDGRRYRMPGSRIPDPGLPTPFDTEAT